MDFAKKILGKYGWKEGDGLGKNNTGIAVPLKASLKFDNAGLGVDRATEFNDHWWERCFNEASSNVSVQVEENGKVSTGRKAGEEAVEISTKGYSARKLKKAKDQQRDAEGGAVYENFLKSALLTQEGGEVVNTDRIKVDDITVSKVHVMTDEELFKACGGRTAHKGARHGLKLSGKLARVEQQEREMLEKLHGKRRDPEKEEPVKLQDKIREPEPEEPVKVKKKKLKKNKAEVEEIADEATPVKTKKRRQVEAAEEESCEPSKSKKKKKKHKQAEE
ncbi:G patch domain-containing protein 4 [Drosophila sulfurigaster albostrigata]|uniref:G patch domain-containing protein 4 n=1 Tax=Drosophila sulfurigaster albostrigata TaxID=89887 RepID=UPI002D2185C0|nr:G patch domain-containing protein 4 [Drosophila sulfurigaster albostrigata]